MAIGAPRANPSGGGAVHTYVWNGSVWSHEQTISPSAPISGISFGSSVSLDGNFLAVGAPDDSTFNSFAGAAYVFEFDGSSWNEIDSVHPPFGVNSFAAFGSAVAHSGSTLVVGAPGQDVPPTPGALGVTGNVLRVCGGALIGA